MGEVVKFPGTFSPELPKLTKDKLELEQEMAEEVEALIRRYQAHVSNVAIIGILTSTATYVALH